MKQLALCLLLLNPLSASAQFTDVMGSRANGMGGSALLETNAWASFNNPAALAMDTGNQIAGNYANSYLLPEIGTSALAAKFSSGTRAFGIGLSSFGYSEFRSNTLQASYAMKLDEHFSMGVNLGLRYLQLGDIYGQSFSPTASLGMMIYINEELSFAALLKDPFNFKIDEAAIDRYPRSASIWFALPIQRRYFYKPRTGESFGQRPSNSRRFSICSPQWLQLPIGFDYAAL